MKAILTCTSAALLAIGVSAANATTINASNFTNASNVHSQAIGDATFTANGGTGFFEKKTHASNGPVLFGNVTGVGIAGGTAGEIDVGETLNVTFTNGPERISSFSLGLLFDGSEYSDYRETAYVTINGTTTGTLVATSATTATWSLGGSVTNLSYADDFSAGVWRVSSPFGTTDVSSIVFGALNSPYCPGIHCGNNSDFTFNELVYDVSPTQTGTVPEPTSLGLLAAGMIGLGIARRHSRKS